MPDSGAEALSCPKKIIVSGCLADTDRKPFLTAVEIMGDIDSAVVDRQM